MSPSPGGQKLEIKQSVALAPLRGSAEEPGFLLLSQPLGAGHATICACSAVGLLGLSASSVCGWAVAAPGTFAAHGTELVLGENVLSACKGHKSI